jgi:hypothetical protein
MKPGNHPTAERCQFLQDYFLEDERGLKPFLVFQPLPPGRGLFLSYSRKEEEHGRKEMEI